MTFDVYGISFWQAFGMVKELKLGLRWGEISKAVRERRKEDKDFLNVSFAWGGVG